MHGYDDMINWTATFRWDADIVTPYAKYVSKPVDERGVIKPAPNKPFRLNVELKSDQLAWAVCVSIDFAEKSKEVAWFVSNCHTINGRLEYAITLSRYVKVDIYGKCSPNGLKCARSKNEECMDELQSDYKFYLAFENSNCRDYISEKFFTVALR
jgi:hypothetical protein